MAIALYGATGYTGRLVTDELVRTGADVVLAGRSAGKLRRLADERAPGARVVAAALDDPAALRALLEDRRVVINCAGPFSLAGEAVLAAALETGTHYVDSTGEQTYMRKVFEHWGPRAERRGVALVPALGFDYAPGDLIARLTAERHEPLDELEIAYAVKGFGASRGTLSSAVEMMKGGDVVYEGGVWRRAPQLARPESFDFPAPIGRKAVMKYPSGEVLTVPRHTETRRVKSRIAAEAFVPDRRLVPVLGLLGLLGPSMALALRSPLRRLVDDAIGRLPEGPSEEQRNAAEFTIAAVARGSDGSVGRGTVRGRDVYGLTAVTLVHGAEQMAATGYARRGALGPAAAYDPASFLDHLAGHGVSWELDGVARAA